MLLPDFYFEKITDISPSFLAERGLSALLLDVDNTLTFDFDPEVPEAVARWLGEIRAAGIKAMIISNNSEKRAAPFAEKCGLPYIARARKPSRAAFRTACEALGCGAENTAMVGDQLFSDVLFGNRARCVTIFVKPMGGEKLMRVRLKRFLEIPLMPFVRARRVKP